MAKNSIDAYGACGKSNVLSFEPEKLHLVTDKSHPLYDERIHLPVSEAMVLNIMDQGVLEPIIVWKDPETGLSCVVDGRQRVRHTLEANIRLQAAGRETLKVPAVTKRGSAVRMAQAMISANEIRQADTPVGRAKKMADALERGHDEDDLALMFGVSTQARQLASLKPDEQREKVRELKVAIAGTRGHEKSRRQRQVLGEAKPRMKSRKDITSALETASGEYAAALRWVLGEEESV
ncbi:ParB N-terminal domain-containing protein [Enterobacter ludwigii]|uniref:ParB N-terminal domain-containing protein n=1 Tax=Enterobacter ludwigii TaxID=299767 RepID=UPI0013CFBFC6|nr:ParB N-terminal domain-containing protein [Enterobacter ludwigii]